MTTQSYRLPNLSSGSYHPADVLYQSLKTAVTKECAGRHDTDVKLRRLEDEDANGSTLHVELDCALLQMAVRIHVTNVGGNVYDVCCSIEEGPSCRFSYSLPAQTGTVLSRAPKLGEKLASFILDELEQQLGRLLLCGSLEGVAEKPAS